MDSQFESHAMIDQNNMVESDSVTINGFSFCTRHGLEVCPKCPTDNRMANNSCIETMLHEKVPEDVLQKKWKGEDREPFAVTHQWTRLSNGKPGCMTHKEVACQECFNWGDKILSGIQGARKTRRARKAREKNGDVE